MFFRNFDLDGDGRISFNEYMLFTTLLSIPTEDIEGTNLAHPHRFQLFFLYSSGVCLGLQLCSSPRCCPIPTEEIEGWSALFLM